MPVAVLAVGAEVAGAGATAVGAGASFVDEAVGGGGGGGEVELGPLAPPELEPVLLLLLPLLLPDPDFVPGLVPDPPLLLLLLLLTPVAGRVKKLALVGAKVGNGEGTAGAVPQ